MRPVDINRMIEAHAKNVQGEWERARMIAYYAVSPYLDGKKNNDIRNVIPMPWDKEDVKEPPKPVSEKDKKLMERIIKKQFNG